MNSEANSSIAIVSPSFKTRSSLWPVWIAAFTTLSLLGTGSADAAPHVKNIPNNKTNHARPAAQGTRLFATGAVDPATSTVKAITSDNRFTWVHLPADVLIVQGGKNTTTDAIGEGNKLSCQGKWVDDAWGPVFQASHIEIIGNIGDASLREKVAAACQALQGTSQSASTSSGSDRGTGADDINNLSAYVDASTTRNDTADHAYTEMDRLADAADSDPAMRHNPQAVKAMRDAVAKYKQALDAVHSLAPVPLVLRNDEEYERQRDQQMKVYADLRLQYFGVNSDHGLHLMGQALRNAHRLNDEAQAALAHDRDEAGL